MLFYFKCIWIPTEIVVFFQGMLKMHVLPERGFSYHISWANQQKADIKMLLWAQCEICKDRRDWHILVGNNKRFVSHYLNSSQSDFLFLKIIGSVNLMSRNS